MGRDFVNVHDLGRDFVNVHALGRDLVKVHALGRDFVNVHALGRDFVNVHALGRDFVNVHALESYSPHHTSAQLASVRTVSLFSCGKHSSESKYKYCCVGLNFPVQA